MSEVEARERERRRDEKTPQGRERAPEPPRARLALYVGVPLLLLVGWGVFSHWHQASAARETLQQQRTAPVDVHVATAERSDLTEATELPGQTAAFYSADIYARATGYIAERRVDIGAKVRKGDLLLRIAAPDLDQQLAQARATLGQLEASLAQAQAGLNQAQNNAKLAKLNSARARILAKEGFGTEQDNDTQSTNQLVSAKSVTAAQAAIGVAVANIRAQQATVDRLGALTSYENVAAPFDGVVTQRYVDIGDLVTADSNSGTELLHVDQQSVLRCQVYVPQSQFTGIHDGLGAIVRVPELADQSFRATVSRTASALTQNSRSMLVEVDVDNSAGKLAPGLFVNVGFDIKRPRPVVMVPDAALIFDGKGMHVAVVGEGDKVQMRPVVVTRDLGTEAELGEGLSGGERVIVNPPTLLNDGEVVQIAQAAEGTRTGNAKGGSAQAGNAEGGNAQGGGSGGKKSTAS